TAWIAASSPNPNPNGATSNGVTGGLTKPAATIDSEPTTTRMKVPTSSARYFRASIRSSAPRPRPTAAGQYGNSAVARATWIAGRVSASGCERERVRVGRDVDGDAALRAVDAQRVEAVQGQIRLTPGAFDGDHGPQPGPWL